MTEDEWLTSADPTGIFLRLKASHTPQQFKSSPRKWRLLACGVCRHLVGFVGRDEYVKALEIGEDYADTGNPPYYIKRGYDDLLSILYELENPTSNYVTTKASIAVRLAAHSLRGNDLEYFGMVLEGMERDFDREYGKAWMESVATSVIRCVLGNPFRPMSVDPQWLTSDVLALAAGIYQDKAFDQMPILADALQDAGCDNESVLEHCRGEGPHVRGCFVVDLILGKS